MIVSRRGTNKSQGKTTPLRCVLATSVLKTASSRLIGPLRDYARTSCVRLVRRAHRISPRKSKKGSSWPSPIKTGMEPAFSDSAAYSKAVVIDTFSGRSIQHKCIEQMVPAFWGKRERRAPSNPTTIYTQLPPFIISATPRTQFYY
eukprot:3224829-Pyramimonas_sp.AAC.1